MSPAADALLKWLLRLVGGVELCAVPFILFPVGWMDAVHARLFGHPLPHGPIVEYLTRSLSVMYAVHGAVVFRVSFDVPRFRPLIAFLGGLHVVLGLTVLGIDLSAGMPWWWVAGEGPGIAVGGVLVLMLAKAGDRET
jgi:hypothetical protein